MKCWSVVGYIAAVVTITMQLRQYSKVWSAKSKDCLELVEFKELWSKISCEKDSSKNVEYYKVISSEIINPKAMKCISKVFENIFELHT